MCALRVYTAYDVACVSNKTNNKACFKNSRVITNFLVEKVPDFVFIRFSYFNAQKYRNSFFFFKKNFNGVRKYRCK